MVQEIKIYAQWHASWTPIDGNRSWTFPIGGQSSFNVVLVKCLQNICAMSVTEKYKSLCLKEDTELKRMWVQLLPGLGWGPRHRHLAQPGLSPGGQTEDVCWEMVPIGHFHYLPYCHLHVPVSNN